MENQSLDRLAALGVATVYEASGRQGLIDMPLQPIIPGSRVAGPARTVLCGQGDNLMVHAAVERIRPGEIVVLAMPEPQPVALIGDLLVTQIHLRGAAGILLNGAVRDLVELVQMGLPIWTAHIRARGATKQKTGQLDAAVSLGGTQIRPGDILVLDADGAVCVPQTRLPEVLARSEERYAREAADRALLQHGQLSYDLYGLRKGIESVASG